MIVYGGGAGIAAVLGFLGFRVWKRRRDTAKTPKVTASDLAASSVFGASTNKNINTSASAPSDFSHSTFDAVDASKEGVDPIQEAEVYMAYGRDGQAEEILRDAMQKDPGNLAVYLKLLEIYVGRKSVPQFNDVAGELHARSSGTGPQWEKAAELGRSLDPSNPLYGGSSRTDEAHNATVVLDTATEPESDPAQFAATQVMSSTPAEEPPAAPEEVSSTMDFDLDLGAPEAESRPAEPAPAQEVASDIDFDLDLGGGEAKLDDVTASGVDINFDEPAKEEGNSIDFNFDLGDSGSAPAAPAEAPLDLSSINLDLTASSAPGTHGADASVVATKLELAQAYEEMGDREGARELLQEVLAEGSPEQQETARTKLAALA